MSELSATAPLLPYVTAPYPDEILGSWLCRIRIENGGGAWRTLLEHVGFGRRIQAPLFNTVDYNEKFAKLLIYLGTTYERVLLELSTLPYWLTFSATDSGALIPGTSALPALRRKSGASGEIASIRPLGSQRFSGKSLEPRYCPQCVSDDIKSVGQPYWHRAHQLPNVFFCHKHHYELQVKCPACGARPTDSDSKIFPLPTLHCKCGCRLDQKNCSRIPSVMELRLVEISVEALYQGVPGWHRDNVLDFMRTQLACGASSSAGRYQRVLTEAFSDGPIQWSARGLEHGNEGKVRFRRNLVTGSAPECCGLLAALNIGVQTAIAGFRAVGLENGNCEKQAGTRSSDMTNEKSRAALVRFSQRCPSRAVSVLRRHYWYLMLNDRTWLREHFPSQKEVQIPSLSDDRLAIIGILSTKNPTPRVRLLARTSPAGLRAAIRDKNWFDEQNIHARRTSAAVAAGVAEAFYMERAAALQNALDKVLSTEKKPTRIFASTLAPLVGLSAIQAADTVKSVTSLADAIAKANAGKLRRQLLWAGKQVNLSGGRFSKKHLARIAGVPTAVVSDEIFAEVKSTYHPKLPVGGS